MGSYGIIIKTEEIRRRVQNGDYDSAQKIIDTIPLKKVKNIADLSLFSEIYIQNERYDDAMELLYRVYKKSKTRRVLSLMLDAAIGRKNIEEAEQLLSEYQSAAPNDYNYYIYRYKIDKLKKEPYKVLIDSLEKLKQHIYLEKWIYELAKLYYKAGMEKECIQECSDIILIFGEGVYVEKAKILKAYFSGEVGKEEIIEKLKNKTAVYNDDFSNKDGLPEQDQEIVPENHDDEVYAEEERKNAAIDDEAENIYETADKLQHEDSYVMDGPANDDFKDTILEEIANNMRKEINSLLNNAQNSEAIENYTDSDEEKDIINLFNLDETNEDLEQLDRLAESLNVNIRHIFGNFLHISDLQNQLLKSLKLITDQNTKSVQLIITGAPLSGKTALAKDIAVFLNKIGRLKTSKIAKISAMKLNDTDLKKRREDLRNSCLVIEKAGELKKDAIDRIMDIIKFFSGDIAVILEDDKDSIERLLAKYPKIRDIFKNNLHIPPYSENDLLRTAYAMIVQRGYNLHPSAFEALNNGLFDIINDEEKDFRLKKICEYVQNAMLSADLRSGLKLLNPGAEGSMENTDTMLIMPEDFTMEIIF